MKQKPSKPLKPMKSDSSNARKSMANTRERAQFIRMAKKRVNNGDKNIYAIPTRRAPKPKKA